MESGLSPQRKKLPHGLPPWVRQGARHFITINCTKRGNNVLARPSLAKELLASAGYYETIGRWYVWLMVVMPDHIHVIATFNLDHGIRRTVGDWKRYQTTRHAIAWQSDFFEHRLRDELEFVEKALYVRMNPVRKGLVTIPSEWPHVMDRTTLENKDGSAGGVAPPGRLAGGASSPSEP